MKNNCKNCWNNFNNYCTLNSKSEEDMKKAQYRQCDGWKKVQPKKKGRIKTQEELEEQKSQRELRILSKFNLGSEFERYLKKGGHYSFPRRSHKMLEGD